MSPSACARGTPAFFINGRFVSGAQPFDSFKSVIDEELARAKKIVDGGVPRARVYAEAIKDGKTSPVMVGGGNARPQPSAPAPDQRYNIAIPAGAPSIGPANAPIVIQEFSDYQCPFCARATGMWQDLHAHFGDRVRYVARHLPLDQPHPHDARLVMRLQDGIQPVDPWCLVVVPS